MVKKHALSAYFMITIFSTQTIFSSNNIVQLPRPQILEIRLKKAGYGDIANKTGLVEKLTRGNLTLAAITAQARFATEVYPLQPSPTKKIINLSDMLGIILQDNPDALSELAQ